MSAVASIWLIGEFGESIKVAFAAAAVAESAASRHCQNEPYLIEDFVDSLRDEPSHAVRHLPGDLSCQCVGWLAGWGRFAWSC